MFLIKTAVCEEYIRPYCDLSLSSSYTKNADDAERFETKQAALDFIEREEDLNLEKDDPSEVYVVECEWRMVMRRCVVETSVSRERPEECPICTSSKTKRRTKCCQNPICMRCEKTCGRVCPFCRASK